MSECLIDEVINDYYTYETGKKVDESLVQNKSAVCFYCNYPFSNASWQLPVNYANNEFKLWGNFCSLECCRSFTCYDNHLFKKDKVLSLIALYAMKIFGKYVRIEKAPSKFLLKLFGGPLSIEEFRKGNESNSLYIVRVPGSGATHCVYDHYYRTQSTVHVPKMKQSKKDSDIRNTKKRHNEEQDNFSEKIRRTTGSVHVKKKSLSLLTSG